MPRFGFPQTGRGVAGDRFARQALDDDAAELVQVDQVRELQAIAECSRSGKDRVAEIDAAEICWQPGLRHLSNSVRRAVRLKARRHCRESDPMCSNVIFRGAHIPDRKPKNISAIENRVR